MYSNDDYLCDNVDLFDIRNHNEVRVIAEMRRAIPATEDFLPTEVDIQDVFALATSSLPPRYLQFGIEVHHEPVTDEMVTEAVEKAIAVVRNNPKH